MPTYTNAKAFGFLTFDIWRWHLATHLGIERKLCEASCALSNWTPTLDLPITIAIAIAIEIEIEIGIPILSHSIHTCHVSTSKPSQHTYGLNA